MDGYYTVDLPILTKDETQIRRWFVLKYTLE